MIWIERIALVLALVFASLTVGVIAAILDDAHRLIFPECEPLRVLLWRKVLRPKLQRMVAWVASRVMVVRCWLRPHVCRLTGHHYEVRFEQTAIRQHCLNCGHVSAGWDLGGRRPVLRFQGRRPE